MVSLRSRETLQKEYDLQAKETVKINLRLQSEPDLSDFRDICVDYATFANVLREFASEDTMVVLQGRPEIKILGESEDYSVTLYLHGNCWRFHVNGKTSYELDETEKVGPGRLLKRIWEVVVPNLPEGFIIRGVINKETTGLEPRSQTLQGLGFSSVLWHVSTDARAG